MTSTELELEAGMLLPERETLHKHSSISIHANALALAFATKGGEASAVAGNIIIVQSGVMVGGIGPW
jgi:hypothetical protein